MPRSSGASEMLRSSVSGLFRLNMGWASPSKIAAIKRRGGSGGKSLRLELPQTLEEMHHERGGDHRGDQIDQRQGKQPGDHDPAEKDASAEAMAHCPGCRCIESSQRHPLEIGAAEKISVEAEEDKKINAREEQINRQSQQVENHRQYHQPQGRKGHVEERVAARRTAPGIVQRLDRCGNAVE